MACVWSARRDRSARLLFGHFEAGFEAGVNAAQTGGDIESPIQIFPATLNIPCRGRAGCYGAQVRYLVRQLDHLGARRFVGGVDDLQSLAFSFRQGFVVRDLHHERGDVRAEQFRDLLLASAGVLDDIVQQAGGDEMRIGARGRLRQQACDLRW